jgi:hypothetical protein
MKAQKRFVTSTGVTRDVINHYTEKAGNDYTFSHVEENVPYANRMASLVVFNHKDAKSEKVIDPDFGFEHEIFFLSDEERKLELSIILDR